MNFDSLVFDFSIDRGGTFTDIYCQIYQKQNQVFLKDMIYKLLSENPNEYPDAPREGIRRILAYFREDTQKKLNKENEEISQSIQKQLQKQKEEKNNQLVDSSQIRSIRMGTTVATNALLERKGAKTALLITKGFRDLLEIGNQSRLKIFDLEMKKVEKLYESVVEVEERVRPISQTDIMVDTNNKVEQVGGQQVEIIQPLCLEQLQIQLECLKQQGIESIAIVLVNAYIYPTHELQVEQLCKSINFTNVSTSHKVINTIKAVNRGCTTIVDAYLNPLITHYVLQFQLGFIANEHTQVFFMQSDGGMTGIHHFTGSRSILSGPAGGVVGLVQAGTKYTTPLTPGILGFDMGGTSTDVTNYQTQIQHIFDHELCGVQIATPHLDIHTVAAGGGSRLEFQGGVFQVGPLSSGAYPGPICYGQQGYLSVTDANLLLGRIQPLYFPTIFGPHQDQPLCLHSTQQAFVSLTQQINNHLTNNGQKTKTIQEVALGYIDVANENMCRAIRNMSQSKGVDPSRHVLLTFGGAAAQHCCAISDRLAIQRVFIHNYAGVFSAYGLSIAHIVEDITTTTSHILYSSLSPMYQSQCLQLLSQLNQEFEPLIKQNQQKLEQYQLNNQCIHQCFLGVKYNGTDTVLMVTFNRQSTQQALDEFLNNYKQEFGFNLQNRDILIENIRVRSHLQNEQQDNIDKCDENSCVEHTGDSESIEQVYFTNEPQNVPVYRAEQLQVNSYLQGPALVIQLTSTLVLHPGWKVYKFIDGLLLIKQNNQQVNHINSQQVNDINNQQANEINNQQANEINNQQANEINNQQANEINNQQTNEINNQQANEINNQQDQYNDPIKLAILGNRFMSIAEEMGKSLQRTSVSVNIKERLDFSCALFDEKGNLVANAPHLPVHLGSMSWAVQYQIQELGNEWEAGQSVLSNHPQAGGSHLPDLTVITPVYHQQRIVFYVASRGHHSDIGGITPGSMPAFSHTLQQEGIAIKSFTLCNQQQGFREQQLRQLLQGEQNIQGSRNLEDNISDLKAQLSANYRGVQLVEQLMKEEGEDIVVGYMHSIQTLGKQQVQQALQQLSLTQGLQPIDTLHQQITMDDQSVIRLALTINRYEGTAIFDLRDTTGQVIGNTNCPPSVVYSAILYCLRCLVNTDIPLNQGCLAPIQVLLKPQTLLAPDSDKAIVGGNVLTSQALTDLILACFNVVANSYGCMNNFTFGDHSFGYYETICGGGGAGNGFNGQDAVQAHMTNTRITDVEVVESRYPVLLEQFNIRRHSGGQGRHKGGDGVVRAFRFLKDNIQVSVLTERRVQRPQGLLGGLSAMLGNNIWISQGHTIHLGSKKSFVVQKGDSVQIHTPGGGGYGQPQQ